MVYLVQAIGLAGTLFCIVYSFLSYRKYKYPSGPLALPGIGNYFSLARLMANPDKELLRLKNVYGELCMLWFGRSPAIILSSPKIAKELMDKRGAIYSSRPAQNNFRETAWPWRLVTVPAGDTFRLIRKIYHNLLGPQQSVLFREYQDYEAKTMLRDLLDEPSSFLLHTERFAMSVIFSAVYGVRLVQLDHPTMVEFYAVWETMLRYFQPGSLLLDFLPVLQRLPKALQPWLSLADRLYMREVRLHKAFLRTLKKASEAGEASHCFGKMLVEVQKQEGIDDDKAVHILAMLIGAGADTTSSVLQSFFKVMALHPEVLKRAQEELDRVVGPDRLPTWEDEYRLPYIRSLIKEVHRWAPIGSLGIPHATTSDDYYNNTFIPAGTIVFPNLTALSQDPERYPNPTKFAPERFLDDHLDASAAALHGDYMKRDHFHYGFGRRLCQGIFVAEASLYIVIARVLWGFTISEKEGCALDMDAKIAGLVTKPKPFEVTIESRGPGYEKIMRRELSETKTSIMNFDDVKLDGF